MNPSQRADRIIAACVAAILFAMTLAIAAQRSGEDGFAKGYVIGWKVESGVE